MVLDSALNEIEARLAVPAYLRGLPGMNSQDSGLDNETFCGGTPDDEPCCPICGGNMQYVDCWNCGGDGGYCEECRGRGGYLECMFLPHTEEQMAAYRARKQ